MLTYKKIASDYLYLIRRFIQETPLGSDTLSSKDKALACSTIVAIVMLLVTGLANISTTTDGKSLTRGHLSQSTLHVTRTYEAPQQIVTTSEQVRNYDNIEYTSKETKTVKQIARNFGVSTDTIRWANNITGDTVKAGTKLKIPPATGLEYKVKKGDTVGSISAYFDADADEVASFNGIKVRALEQGQVIFIPDGEKPILPSWKNDPSGYSTVIIARNGTPSYISNAYPWGNCTWYAYNRRVQLGKTAANGLGNASSWRYTAARKGFKVDHTPTVGAIMAEAGTNHVAIVERINPDGSILISEMNYAWRLGVKSYRTIPGSSVIRHSYIH